PRRSRGIPRYGPTTPLPLRGGVAGPSVHRPVRRRSPVRVRGRVRSMTPGSTGVGLRRAVRRPLPPRPQGRAGLRVRGGLRPGTPGDRTHARRPLSRPGREAEEAPVRGRALRRVPGAGRPPDGPARPLPGGAPSYFGRAARAEGAGRPEVSPASGPG